MINDLLPQRRSKTLVLELRDQLERAVRAGRMRTGEKIPSEVELAHRFAVSRSSVREALKLLEQDGLIDVQHGSGRFVSASATLLVNRPITHFESITEMLEGLGYRPVNRVLSVERTKSSKDEQVALGLDPDAEVVRLRRLRLHDGRALVLSINVFAAELLGDENLDRIDFSGSLNDWLVSKGHGLVSAAAEIRAASVPDDVIALPGVDPDLPWLLISEHCVDCSGSPVLMSKDFHRGDVFAFRMLRRREA